MLGGWALDLLKAFTLSQPAECSAGDLLISAHFLSASGAAVSGVGGLLGVKKFMKGWDSNRDQFHKKCLISDHFSPLKQI